MSAPSQHRHRLFWCTLLTHPRPPDDYQLHNGVDKDDDDSGDDGDEDCEDSDYTLTMDAPVERRVTMDSS